MKFSEILKRRLSVLQLGRHQDIAHLLEVADARTGSRMKFSEILKNRHKEIQAERKAILRGEDPRAIIPTGLREFDKRAGHKRKILHLYGAATGEGKSIWKLHLQRAAAMAGYSVCVVDFEDPEDRTADREFSHATGINNAKMMAGDLTDKEVQQIGLACAEAEGWASQVEVELGVKTAEEALATINEGVYDLVLVDYLSAIPHGKHGRERAISDFCWGLTKYCQDNDAAGIAFAQLVSEVSTRGMRMYEMDRRNKQFGKSDGEQPLPYIDGFRGFDNNDLAWCKDAGKTAKELGFMFRPGRYYKRLDPKTKVKDNIMEFNFPKRNFGSEGRLTVAFDGKTATLSDLPEK
jgi:replicative DNA helicase